MRIIPTEQQKQEIRSLFKSKPELTIQQVADETLTTYKIVHNVFKNSFSEEERKMRKVGNYRRSKLGDKNPMKGITKEQHHSYIGRVSDGKGYMIVLKPDWYTGRKGCKHVFEHHVVMCEALGLTEIPKGWSIHHIDRNKTNNEISNLALMTLSAHSRIHHSRI